MPTANHQTKKATKPQAEVLRAIRSYIAKNGFPPTLREIGKSLKRPLKNVQGVVCHLEALERKGLIRRVPHTQRGIVVLEPQVKAAS